MTSIRLIRPMRCVCVHEACTCKNTNFSQISAFSVTTTSTSSYIDVERPRGPPARSLTPDSAIWSPLDARNTHPLHDSHPRPQSCRNASPKSVRRNNRSNKQRTNAISPASPAEVLARNSYNHSWTSGDERTPLTAMPLTELPRLARALSRRFLKHGRRGGNEDQWVCVEVQDKVTQHELCDEM